jgi:FkbM family methyltransferase
MDSFVCVNEHTLLRPGVGTGPVVVDLGANHGAFATALSALAPDAVIHGIEANPLLISGLRNGPYATVSNVAVTDHGECVRLRIADSDQGSSVVPLARRSGADELEAVSVPGRSLESILADIPGPLDVVKVDIEGAEVVALPALSAETLGRIGQLTVEFHHGYMFGLAVTRRETRSAISHVRRHGFAVLRFRERDIDVLLLNRARFELSRRQEWAWRVRLVRVRWAGRVSSLRARGLVIVVRERLRSRGHRRPA